MGQDKAELEREALEDLQAARDACEAGDLEDFEEEPDMVLPVTVSDEGVLTVMDPEGAYVLSEYTPEQVYGAFGMDPPAVLPDQREEAWAVIREQLDGLAELFRANGLDRAETEYLQEDGVAGLQDVNLFGYDDVPADPLQDPGQGEYPLPPLVSSTNNGQMTLVPLDGSGTLRDVADAVFESLSEFILNDPAAVIDRIRIRLSSEGDLKVETDAFVKLTWTPPGAGGPDPEDDTPGL